MTANELADILDRRGEDHQLNAANMLRQQAEEIIDLECEKERQREKFEEMLCDRDVEIEQLQDRLNEFLVARDLAILRKAQEK